MKGTSREEKSCELTGLAVESDEMGVAVVYHFSMSAIIP